VTIRVLIADDHALVRDAIRGLLEKQPDIEVVAEAADGAEALERAAEFTPDVVVMDIGMRGMSGIEATGHLAEAAPGARVLAVSMHTEREFVAEMLKAGASGYIVKDDALEDVLDAVRTVAAGGTYLSSTVAGVVIGDYVRQLNEPTTDQRADTPLTARELEVLALIAEGCTTKEIASRLGVSVKTVETHRRQIMEKTGIFSVVGLAKYALRLGLASLDD
jgi:DNA-binding NarL/FixJ family response regulator